MTPKQNHSALETLLTRYAKYFAYGVLAISVVLMGYVVYEINQAKHQFANKLITQSVTQTEHELDNFFENIEHLLKAVEQQYEMGLWQDLPNPVYPPSPGHQ